MSRDWGVKISKENENVSFCANKDLIISSKFDTFKIGYSGRLTLDYPAWDYDYVGDPISTTDTVYFEHNLGYIPYYTPRCVMEAPDGNSTYINEMVRGQPLVNYSPPSWERAYIDVYATTTRLYIRFVREFNYATDNTSGTYPEGTIYMDYIVFRNKMDAEFNLLD